MNERVIQFRVGVVVVAATIITGIMIMLFGEGQALIRKQYTIYLLFDEAPGVTVDTPVRKHGVLIGRVSRVELREEDGVRLTVRVDAKRRLRKNEVCLIKSASLLGDAVLEFVKTEGSSGSATEFVGDGDTIADGIVATNPLEVITSLQGDIQNAIGAIESAANEVQRLAQGVNTAFGTNDDQIRRIVNKSELAVDRFTQTMTSIDDIVGDPELRNSLKSSLQSFPLLLDEVQLTLGAARKTMGGIDEISSLAQQNLENLKDFTGPLGQRGEELTASIAASVENFNAISAELVDFSAALNNRGGTLGRLLYDPELYNSLDDTIGSLNRIVRRLNPIVDDARKFTDKISRDPRQLGLKGAIDRKPLGFGP
jgi:phospholipid/cholesterol/gamma-HCH transport system substrate-binding protein